MGLFGKKKKAWDEGRIQENKAKMRALFEQVVEDAAGYQLVYAYSSSVKTSITYSPEKQRIRTRA